MHSRLQKERDSGNDIDGLRRDTCASQRSMLCKKTVRIVLQTIRTRVEKRPEGKAEVIGIGRQRNAVIKVLIQVLFKGLQLVIHVGFLPEKIPTLLANKDTVENVPNLSLTKKRTSSDGKHHPLISED